MDSKKFTEYYEKYLGYYDYEYINGYRICLTDIRDKPINQSFYHSVIIANYNNEIIISVSPENKRKYLSKILNCLKDANFDNIMELVSKDNPELNIRKMYRMALLKEEILEERKLENLDYIYMEGEYRFRALYNNQIVSYCKISDIHFGFGNIVVRTDENYRNKGIAKSLLIMLINKCKELDIETIYLVDSRNMNSIKLAQSVGYEILSTEIIINERDGSVFGNT